LARTASNEARFGAVVGVEVEGEALDEGGPDDGGVGGARHFSCLVRVRMPKPTAIGNCVNRRRRVTEAAILAASAERVPVMPATAT